MTKIEEKELLKTPVFTVVEKTFEDSRKPLNFKPVGLNCNDWVMIVARDKFHRTVVVKQTRWGIEEQTFELPCGTVEAGEAPKDAAIREFKEEVGIEIEPQYVKEVLCFNPNPAYFNNKMHVFVAEYVDLLAEFNNRKDQKLDKDEDCIPMLTKIDYDLKTQLLSHGMGVIAWTVLNT